MKDSGCMNEEQIYLEGWKNHLIEVYVEYWRKLQENPYFQYNSLHFTIKNLRKLQEKVCPDHHEMLVKRTVLGKVGGRIEATIKKLEKEKEAIWDEISKKENVAEEKEMIIRILQAVEKELTQLKVKIIKHPSGKLEFLDTENKVKLEYPIKKDRRVISGGKF